MKQSEMVAITMTVDRVLKDQAKLIFCASNISIQNAVGHFLEECVGKDTPPSAIDSIAHEPQCLDRVRFTSGV